MSMRVCPSWGVIGEGSLYSGGFEMVSMEQERESK
jgi:hypothetical protein